MHSLVNSWFTAIILKCSNEREVKLLIFLSVSRNICEYIKYLIKIKIVCLKKLYII